jgi:GH15 family glucan-1,4-alpha-glucosidase
VKSAKNASKANFLSGDSTDRMRNNFARGTAFGTALGVLATLVYQYIARIWRQPRLESKAVLSDLRDFDNRETRALFIATESLHAGIAERRLENREQKRILHAGYRNFRESWARDFGFATYGLLALEEHKTVQDTLEAFFWHQRPQGQLPVKLQSLNVFTRYIHSLFGREQPLERQLTPKYRSGHRTASLDGQALLVIAACEYITQTRDRDFALEHWEALQMSIQWLQLYKQRHGALLHQAAYADWADSVARSGAVLYTNVVYWKALQEMSCLADFLGYQGDISFYQQMAKQVRSDLLHRLWRPHFGYFATSQVLDNLSSAGNLLAVAWGLPDEEKSNCILDALRAAEMATPVPTQAAKPPYPDSMIAIENRLGGLANYHTEGAWLWIGAWHLIALCRLGRMSEAQNLLERMAETITRDQQVHEVYGLNGQPLSTLWYTSETPLTWNAAMIIYAFSIIEDHLES